jgi:uncharacterized membrane protein YedE/YeeE
MDEEEEAKPADFCEIFSLRYRARTILASINCMTQSTHYFAVGFKLPSISRYIFGSDFLSAILGTVCFDIFGIVGGFGCAYATAALGVRRLAAIGYAIVIAARAGC